MRLFIIGNGFDKAEGIDVSALDDSDEDIFGNRCTITLL